MKHIPYHHDLLGILEKVIKAGLILHKIMHHRHQMHHILITRIRQRLIALIHYRLTHLVIKQTDTARSRPGDTCQSANHKTAGEGGNDTKRGTFENR